MCVLMQIALLFREPMFSGLKCVCISQRASTSQVLKLCRTHKGKQLRLKRSTPGKYSCWQELPEKNSMTFSTS